MPSCPNQTLPTVEAADLDADAVTTVKILDSNVTTAKIADDAVTSAKVEPGVIQVDTVTIATADVKQLNAAPYELVAAPGAGKLIEFISAAMFLDYATATYDTNGNLTIQTGTTGTAVSDQVAEADFLFGAADTYRIVQALSADVQGDVNESLVLACAVGEPATGDSPVVVKVAYRIHDFS